MRAGVLGLMVAVLAVGLTAPEAGADPGYNPSRYDCVIYAQPGYPTASGTKTTSVSPVFGGHGTANYSSTAAGAAHVDTSASGGKAAPVDPGLGLAAPLMGNGTADASAVRHVLSCDWHGSSYFTTGHASATVMLSSQSTTGTLGTDHQSGAAGSSYIEVRATFYPVECAFAGTNYGDDYYSCKVDYNDYATATQRTSCWPGAAGCTEPSSVTVSADVPATGCTYNDPPVYCTGVYADIGVYAHSDATGDTSVISSASADATIGDLGA